MTNDKPRDVAREAFESTYGVAPHERDETGRYNAESLNNGMDAYRAAWDRQQKVIDSMRGALQKIAFNAHSNDGPSNQAELRLRGIARAELSKIEAGK